jgi:DNA-binding winged helix-turn-helix (wHTH) protein
MRLYFGEFVVDLDERRLLGRHGEIHLAPKVFELLKVLIERRPKALAKDALFAHLWPDTFVTENNLAALIAALRSALAEDAGEPRFIRTVYAYGYAFAAEAVEQASSSSAGSDALPRWRLIHEKREILLEAGDNILGRTDPGVVAFESPTISRRHACVRIAGDEAVIKDLGSKNGTWVGQLRVTATPAPVRDGDELRLGSVVLLVRFGAPSTSTETLGDS